MYKIGMTLRKREGVTGSASYTPRVTITDYDTAYRRWILDDGVEMTSASLEYLYTAAEVASGEYL